MNNDIYLIGDVGYDLTLKTLIDLLKETDKTKPLNVHIHSPGGVVYDGLAIYKHLKGLDQEVNTFSSGLVASIATIIFLAGKNRTVNSTDSFLIHLPMGMADGNAVDLEKTAKQLRDIENQIADIYVAETNITREEAFEMMKVDEMIPTDILKEKGFVTDIVKFKAVATLNTNINTNKQQMELTKEDKSWIDKQFDAIKAIINPSVITNKIVQDATGVEIDFLELEEDATPKDGDRAQVDGAPADGAYVMPSGETYTFAEGVLTVTEAEAEEEEAEDVQALKDEIERLKGEVEASNATNVELEATNQNIKTEYAKFEKSIKSKFKLESKLEDKDPDDNKRKPLI